MERDKKEPRQQQQSDEAVQHLDLARRDRENGINLERDSFGHSDIQAEAKQPAGASGGLIIPGDNEEPGGSSSTHTRTQSDALARHRQPGSAHLDRPETDLGRGGAFDQAQGGGRGPDEVD